MSSTGPADRDAMTGIAETGARISRRTFVTMLTAAAGMAGSVRAVAAPDALVWDIASGPQYVDPVMGTSAQASVLVVQNVYERLVWYDGANMEPIPWLATGWEITDGGQRYVFKLRKGIKFQDGSAFDTNAVKFSFDRAVLLDDPIGIGSFFPTGTAAPGIFKGAWEFSKSFGVGKDYSQAAVDKYLAAGAVKVIDPETVEFNLAQPYAAFISDMATFMGSIVSPAYVTAHWKKPSDPQRGFMPGVTAGQRDDWMLYNASGTGPYALSTFDKATGNVVLKANPTYWGGPQAQIKPNVQSVIVRATLDQATRLLDLKSGSVDRFRSGSGRPTPIRRSAPQHANRSALLRLAPERNPTKDAKLQAELVATGPRQSDNSGRSSRSGGR